VRRDRLCLVDWWDENIDSFDLFWRTKPDGFKYEGNNIISDVGGRFDQNGTIYGSCSADTHLVGLSVLLNGDGVRLRFDSKTLVDKLLKNHFTIKAIVSDCRSDAAFFTNRTASTSPAMAALVGVYL
jgi:hypothetical protein